jgi:hypothetical protein
MWAKTEYEEDEGEEVEEVDDLDMKGCAIKVDNKINKRWVL